MGRESKEQPAVTDLRSALERLKRFPSQLLETNHPVDSHAELADQMGQMCLSSNDIG